jgi:spore coat protein A
MPGIVMKRRDFLRIAGGGTAVLLTDQMPARGAAPRGQARSAPTAQALAPYVDRLPIPPVLRAPAQADTAITIRMRPCLQKVHRDLPATALWGYNGTWPGPTLDVRRGQTVRVNWVNELPATHFLPIDRTIHGADEQTPEVRTVVHLHGARVWPDSDGYPEAWSTSDGKTGAAHARRPALYSNDQPAATLWYHDHAIGITRLNVYAGLAGLYLVRDDEEDGLNLPRGPFEIPLIIQDRTFNIDGSLRYPTAQAGTHPQWIQEFLGDSVCVNGKVMPFLETEPRKYRFRLLNASNSRFYHLRLARIDRTGRPGERPADALLFHQIGTDGGLLPRTLTLRALVVAPGERIDFILDFSGHWRGRFAMINDAPAPYTRGGGVVPADVMRFEVTRPLSGPDTSTLPETLATLNDLDPTQAVRERVLAVTEIERPSDGYVVIGLLGGRHWNDAITEDPSAGSTEIWSFANATGDVHPIHVHLVRFQVLNRQTFDVKTYLQTGRLVLTGIPLPPEANERPAWKDTVKAYPGYLTRVIQRFDLPAGPSDAPGEEWRYVWHCHMLEHEDNEMMRPYKIVRRAAASR